MSVALLNCCNAVHGVEIDQNHDYINRRTGQLQMAALDQGALHSLQVGNLHHHESALASLLEKWWSVSYSAADDTAALVIANAREMCRHVTDEGDMLHSAWRGPNGKDPLKVLLGEEDVQGMAEKLCYMANNVAALHAVEPTVVEASAPAKIFGDIHGHFRDMLLLLHDFGFPTGHGPTYIFNGDWVDRGAHQLEVVALVMALKLAYPNQIVLLRGNHEERELNQHMGEKGFYSHCQKKLGGAAQKVFDRMQSSFEVLPLGCVVAERVFVVHGGIGDGAWDISSIEHVPRPLSTAALEGNTILYNMLWSDPVAEEIENGYGVHRSARDNRDLIKTFGQDVSERFLMRNHLDMIIRSHEVKPKGKGYEAMHGGKCIRVFSARDYEGYGNDAAILSLVPEDGLLVVRPQVLFSITR
mmetsp:Transcript_36830/g.84861  ORF Transcript_36830/g.84861 Transcript_36830/m.84861 type:complete len:414 (+) Transcript_36830:116-1357(+)